QRRRTGNSLPLAMRTVHVLVVLMSLNIAISAASKPHVVSFGKPQPVKVFIGAAEIRTMDITVSPLFVDAKLKEYTTGKQHDVTDRQFVVRRAFRINDALPDEARKSPKWLWELGGWLLVDRSSGRITPIKLLDFDPFYSEVSWYRDYAAYCGTTANGEKLDAVVVQIGVKKPLYRKELGKANGGEQSDSDCSAPQWNRQPARVTFLPKVGDKLSVTVRGRFVDEVPDDDSDEP
ncbi:MAG TPA: hypothetical protein VFC15_05255, partial [Candidatus Limnocylindrales bacterium]|nr:hypothetical protein [Candidatus Limnocylindrales bacterium]HZM09600.1 hypothetical protein [Candidatus Limnocylindrales bacterium]